MDTIVKSVLNLSVVLFATNFPVGLQSHMEAMIQTIKNRSTEVCMIGICGMEGSGTTTISKAIYNHIHGTLRRKVSLKILCKLIEPKGMLIYKDNLCRISLNQRWGYIALRWEEVCFSKGFLGKGC